MEEIADDQETKLEVSRTNGASVYTEVYTFDCLTDALNAQVALTEAQNTTATII